VATPGGAKRRVGVNTFARNPKTANQSRCKAPRPTKLKQSPETPCLAPDSLFCYTTVETDYRPREADEGLTSKAPRCAPSHEVMPGVHAIPRLPGAWVQE